MKDVDGCKRFIQRFMDEMMEKHQYNAIVVVFDAKSGKVGLAVPEECSKSFVRETLKIAMKECVVESNENGER